MYHSESTTVHPSLLPCFERHLGTERQRTCDCREFWGQGHWEVTEGEETGCQQDKALHRTHGMAPTANGTGTGPSVEDRFLGLGVVRSGDCDMQDRLTGREGYFFMSLYYYAPTYCCTPGNLTTIGNHCDQVNTSCTCTPNDCITEWLVWD